MPPPSIFFHIALRRRLSIYNADLFCGIRRVGFVARTPFLQNTMLAFLCSQNHLQCHRVFASVFENGSRFEKSGSHEVSQVNSW